MIYPVYGTCKETFLVSFETSLREFWHADMVCVVEIVFLISILC